MVKKNILVIPPDTHGVGKFRILDPFKFIGDNYQHDFHVDIVFNVPNENEYFKKYDIVVFHSFIHQTTHEDNVNRIKWLKKEGIKTIMDIDDYWSPDQRHPAYRQIISTKTNEHKVEILKLVDYITTTTDHFKKTIIEKLKIENVFVFPNAVNENENQFIPKPIKSDKVRFGWIGGSSHLYDIELLKDGIHMLHDKFKKNSQLVLCGFDIRGSVTEFNKTTNETFVRPIKPEETVWYKYEKIFTKNYDLNLEYKKFLLKFLPISYEDTNEFYRRRWTMDVNNYATNYNHFDVSLIPLVPTLFNSNKSQLKIIESGFHKKAVIVSETEPYIGDLTNAITDGKLNETGNALFVNPKKDHKDWFKNMKKVIENPEIINILGERLYNTVKDKYSLKKVSEDRVNFLKTI